MVEKSPSIIVHRSCLTRQSNIARDRLVTAKAIGDRPGVSIVGAKRVTLRAISWLARFGLGKL
jgi:hypothetical protein